MPTDAQRAADAAMRRAVQRAVHAYQVLPRTAAVIDFVVVVQGARHSGRDDPGFRAVLYRDGAAATVIAHDLVAVGTALARGPRP